jgi:hypothetical protein
LITDNRLFLLMRFNLGLRKSDFSFALRLLSLAALNHVTLTRLHPDVFGLYNFSHSFASHSNVSSFTVYVQAFSREIRASSL